MKCIKNKILFDEKSQPDEETFGRPIWELSWTVWGVDLEPEKEPETTQNLDAFLDLKEASTQTCRSKEREAR